MYYRKTKKGKFIFEINKKGAPRISKSFTDLKLGKRWAAKVELQIENNEYEDLSIATKTDLKHVLIKYRDEITSKKKGHKEEAAKLNVLIRHKIAFTTLMKLKPHHIHQLQQEFLKTRAPATVNKYLSLLRNTWRSCKKVWGITLPPYNPFELISFEKVKDARERILTIKEYDHLLMECSNSNLPQLKDIVIFAYETGARQGEIVKLLNHDVNLENSTCTFRDTKNGVDRTIPLTYAALDILKRNRFSIRPFDVLARRIRKHFSRACKRSKIHDFRFHDLRACFCTNALLSGMTIPQVAAISGHKDWSQLKRYTRIKATDLTDHVNKISSIREFKKINK